MNKITVLIATRLFLGSLVLFAIGVQLYRHMHFGFDVVNYFSYFTNLSNIFAGIVLLLSSIQQLQNKRPTTFRSIVRGSSTVAMIIVGIVYVVLLRHEDLGVLLPWVNIVLHYMIPVYMLFDWFYAPTSFKITPKHIMYWMIFPLAFLVYSLIRGAIVHWYPYPFLNPDKVGGYYMVALYCIGITAVFFGVSWILSKVAGRKQF